MRLQRPIAFLAGQSTAGGTFILGGVPRRDGQPMTAAACVSFQQVSWGELARRQRLPRRPVQLPGVPPVVVF
jgi:hypothetical protein